MKRLAEWIETGSERTASLLDRHSIPAWCAFSAFYVGATLWIAARKPFWFDELVTLNICRLDSLQAIWQAFNQAADSMPPLLHLATRASLALFGENEVSARLPGILGVWVLSLCLYRFARRHCPAIYAWTAASAIPLVMISYGHAVEARAYGLLMGFTGAALVCWQSISGRGRRWWLLALTVAVAGAVFSHPSGMMVAVALGIGELVRARTSRKCDWWALAALFFGACVVFLLLPAIAASGSTYRGSAWSTPKPTQILTVYRSLLAPVVWPYWIAAVLTAAVRMRPRREHRTAGDAERWPIPAPEAAVIVALLIAPAGSVSLGLLTGVFSPRYTLPSLAGAFLLAAYLSHAVDRARPLLGALLLALTLAHIALDTRRAARAVHRAADTTWVPSVQTEPALPVVVDDAIGFLEQTYYAPRKIVPRLVFLADPARAFQATGNQSATIGLMLLARWVPLRVEQPADFLASHRRFYLLGLHWYESWLRPQLVASGVHPRLVALGSSSQLYLVELNNGAFGVSAQGSH